MIKYAVLVGSKGRGSNMAALLSGSASGSVPAECALVVSPKAETPAILRAQAFGVKTEVLPYKSECYGEKLMALLTENQVEIICLAGYMTLLPAGVVEAYRHRILNIHPALLPKFGGKGMYGNFVHEAVLAGGETESGCTVHYVTEEYDEGAPIIQKRCPVLSDDTVETLSARVLDLEHAAYQEALTHVARKIESGEHGQED